jgi:hypothetical protein
MNVHDWLYYANALALVLERGVVGETCNVGGRNERSNLHVVHTICDLLDTMELSRRESHRRLVRFVTADTRSKRRNSSGSLADAPSRPSKRTSKRPQPCPPYLATAAHRAERVIDVLYDFHIVIPVAGRMFRWPTKSH